MKVALSCLLLACFATVSATVISRRCVGVSWIWKRPLSYSCACLPWLSTDRASSGFQAIQAQDASKMRNKKPEGAVCTTFQTKRPPSQQYQPTLAISIPPSSNIVI